MKRWWQSKMNWFNLTLVMSMAGVALTYLNDFGLDAKTTAVIGFGLTTFQTIGNVYLRSITHTGIGIGGHAPDVLHGKGYDDPEGG